MKINCEVQVNNRMNAVLNVSNAKKIRSSLGIGRPPGSKADRNSLFIQLCTAHNKQGVKYKIIDNIEGVFTKFISEGKFTIRFKQPTHELCVKADPVLAKTFLQTLKLGIQNKDIDKLHLSTLAPAKQREIEKPKTKLIITHRKDYPITTSFPYTLVNLTVRNVDLNRVENRIMKLKHLKNLNLSDNLIKEIPLPLGQMPNLSELHLANNKLTFINHTFFEGTITRTLGFLDLSNNEIEYLPHTLGKLKSLYTLKLDNNKLKKLPISLGKLSALRNLSTSNNQLVELPATLINLHLDQIDIFSNPLNSPLGVVKNCMPSGVKTLREIVSSYCVKRGLRPSASDIPATLVEYLSSWMRCPCGRICYESHILARFSLDLKTVTASLTINNVMGSSCPVLATICSSKCKEKYVSR
ncbi:unnamed protein product [Meganyctiphanes norvegica]|uniref:PIF1/LRR1 pleckstrin homology domain-containing protein n=1 Tax=Meganyctiphanes norvegica TaxID=48144 RepID=A0AAV2SJ43_MEGNR